MPKKLFVLIFSLYCIPLLLLAYDYSHCVKYFKAASTPVGSTYAISLKNNKDQHHILYSATRPKNAKILKADPFVGLYLIAAPKTKQSYEFLPLDSRTLKDKNLIFASSATPQKGTITKRQDGFLNYARFSAKASSNAVLGNICYQIYGLSIGGQKFIEYKYIKRFLDQKSPYYGDLGIRTDGYSAKPIVSIIDPFMPNNPFMPNDEILTINNQKISSAGELEWVMSNLKKDSSATITLKRNTQTITLKAKVGQRYGGFLLKETFLERFGIEIDKNMVIQSINPSLAGRFSKLRVGDRIEWINKQPILLANQTPMQAYERLKLLLSNAHFDERFGGQMQFLIIRDQLEIFIKI